MKLISIVPFALILLVVLGCGPSDRVQLLTETQDFAYVATNQNDDIDKLNQWLRANSSKRVISFAGVLAYREGVNGYIVYFAAGDNSKQQFARVDKVKRQEPETSVNGFNYLQGWKNQNPNANIVAITTVPNYSGGVREFTICYEQP